MKKTKRSKATHPIREFNPYSIEGICDRAAYQVACVRSRDTQTPMAAYEDWFAKVNWLEKAEPIFSKSVDDMNDKLFEIIIDVVEAAELAHKVDRWPAYMHFCDNAVSAHG